MKNVVITGSRPEYRPELVKQFRSAAGRFLRAAI